MSQSGQMRAPSIDERTREAARAAAAAKGMTLGEFLNQAAKAGATDTPATPEELQKRLNARQGSTAGILERLTKRIEAVEARSTEAITSMDEAILSLVTRLEANEDTSSAVAGYVEGLVEEFRSTQSALQAKVDELEQDNSSEKNLNTLKALEQALSKLASHVFDEHEMAQNEAAAMRGRIESGFTDLNDRFEGVEVSVTRKLDEHTKTMSSAREELKELRAETDKKLTETNSQMLGMQDRLHIAENTTDAALKNLQASYESLDQKFESLAGSIDPDLGDSLRAEFEARFQELSASVRETIEQTRTQLAEDILQAASAHTDGAVADLKQAVDAVSTKVEEWEPGIAEAELTRRLDEMADGIETRLETFKGSEASDQVEALRAEVAETRTTLNNRFDTFTDLVEQRITDHEQRNASAIAQMGDQVSTATQRFQSRQDDAFERMNNKIETNQEQATARLSDALANVSDRLEQLQAEATTHMSPVQKALASLASRLELIEDTVAPQAATAPEAEEYDFQDDSAALYEDIGELEETEPVELEPLDTRQEDEDALFETEDELATDAHDEAFTELASLLSGSGLDEIEEALSESTALEAEPGIEDAETLAAVEEADEWFDPDYASFAEPETSPDIFDLLPKDTPLAEAAEEEAESETEDAFSYGLDDDTREAEDDPFAIEDEAYSDTSSDDIDALLAALKEETQDDPLDALLLHGDDERTEARDSDVFDDFETDLQTHEEIAEDELSENDDSRLESVIPAEETQAETSDAEAQAELDPLTSDYITRARRAAIAASAAGKPARSSKGERAGLSLSGSNGGQSRLPLYAAASALAVSGAAVGGYLYMRGKQPPEAVTELPPAAENTAPPAAETATLATDTTPTEDLLFDPVETDAPVTQELDVEAPSAELELSAPPAEASAPAPRTYPGIPELTTLQTAAESGNRIAQFVLGQNMVAGGDIREGVTLIRQSANAGLPVAQYELARLHDSGTGVPKDLALSRSWMMKAAEGGNVKAMYDLAVFMAEGEGGPRSYTGASEWFRKAAAHGVVDSQYNLGILYEQGLGVSQDKAEALYWFTVAANNGDAGAPSKIVQVSDALSPAVKAEVSARADRWQPVISPSIANGRFGAQPWDLGNAEQVQAIQTALNTLGYEAGPADGIMGTGTAYAIRLYQRTYNLPVTGTVTMELIDSLNAAAEPVDG